MTVRQLRFEPDMALVGDVMEPSVVRLRRDQTVAEAASVLTDHDISGAPVCDLEGHVLGVLSKTDVVECAALSELGSSVERIMTLDVISVRADEPLERAIAIMAFEGVHRLFVLDSGARLLGVITAMGVLRELAGYGRKDARRVVAVGPPDTSPDETR